MCMETNTELAWRPILVGGVFNAVNPSVYEARTNPVPIKALYYQKDLQDWARYRGIKIGWPEVFPVNSVKAMRGAFLAIEKECIGRSARKVFEAYWGELRDISKDTVLRSVVNAVGLDESEFFDAIAMQKYKDKLRNNTEELVERGGYGTPTIFVNETNMFFGQDRLSLVRKALEEAK